MAPKPSSSVTTRFKTPMSGPAAKDWTSRAEKVVYDPIIPTAQNCRVVCENLPRYIDSYMNIPRKKQTGGVDKQGSGKGEDDAGIDKVP